MQTAAAHAAFQAPDFPRWLVARFASIIGIQMQLVAVGWHVYDLTGRALDLGLLGLVQFLPAVALSLVTGYAADRFDRRKLLCICHGALAVCSAALALHAYTGARSVGAIYAVLALFGAARAFRDPAGAALLPQLVPLEHFNNAISWNSSVAQTARVLGPALGGAAYALAGSPGPVYVASSVLSLAALWQTARLETRSQAIAAPKPSLATLLAGLRYVWRKKILLGSISLDLFAVLLGGATALLPIFARDYLHTGPWGLGALRSAPAVGAGLTAVGLAHRPLSRKAGARMLACVVGFGLCTVGFGLSRSFWLSIALLSLLGAFDMVSVNVRLTLEQLATPDHMRGRVSAVNMLFIGASNELGEFESGLTAAWFGAVPAVLIGGVGTIVVVAIWTLLFPSLAKLDRLSDAG